MQSDKNVKEIVRLITPRELKATLPLTRRAEQTVGLGRNAIIDILRQDDPRLLVIIGPCSIHDEKGAMEYATRLNELRAKVSNSMEIVMRVYFEKPRTTVGWKGLINDPHLDGSQDIEEGLKTARRLLLKINGMGMPAATEFLDPLVPQYIDDLVSWAAIGARTTESQTHREMTSGLSMPVGLKNATDGGIQVAVDAIKAAREPHSFLGVDMDGRTGVVRTKGNLDVHLVLRGGRNGTNYDRASIRVAETVLRDERLPPVLMVDCSHANSEKQHARQEGVWKNVIGQRIGGTLSLMGLMVESNLREGSQKIPAGADPTKKLIHGVSVTDACIGWETTERMLGWAHEELSRTV